MTDIKPPIHQTRESFFDQSNWSVSKKGNAYIRDHGHTYTIKVESEEPKIHVVVVRFDGERTDFFFTSEKEMADELWPEGESSPRGVP